MEISFLNNIKKYNSKSNKGNITNIINEAFRDSEEFKNNVNKNLIRENKVLVRKMDLLQRQYEDTEVRSTTKDIITVVSSIQTGNFEATTGQDLTYLLSVEDWQEYYKKNLEFLQKKLGENANCVYATIHFDESTPHLHSMWTFSEENKQENATINYEKVDKALRNNFSNKNKKELRLKAGTKEYKEALEKYKEENRQKVIDKQLKKIQSRTSDKAFKCETGTSVINREFYRTINEDFKNEVENTKVIQKLQRKIEAFSTEDCRIVKQRSEKHNMTESLDRAKHSMKTEAELLADKINQNDYTETELERFKLINAKRVLVEEKKEISLQDFKNKFDEAEAKYRSIEKNRAIAKALSHMNLKKIYRNIIESNSKKKRLKKHFENELKIFDKAIERQHSYKNVDEIIEKAEKIESAEIKIQKNEELERKYEKLAEKCDALEDYVDLLEEKAKKGLSAEDKKRLQAEADTERKIFKNQNKDLKAEIERLRTEKYSIIDEYKQQALEKAEQEAKRRFESENADKLKKSKELNEIIEQQQRTKQLNEKSLENFQKQIAEIKKENEEIEKQVAEKRKLKIEELAEKSLKNAPILDFEIDDYIEKNQEKFQNLLENREAEVEAEIVENMKEDTKEAFAVFQDFINEYAKKMVYKDLVSFREAKRLTIKAFSEISAFTTNFLSDFIENLKSKVQDFIAKRQKAVGSRTGQETNTRQGKSR